MPLNDLEWLFHVKFCWRAGLLTSDRATFENSCVNTDKDRPILSAAQIFGRDSVVSGNITFVRIFAQVLWKGEVGLRVNARLEPLFLAFKNNCVNVSADRPTLQQLRVVQGL